MNKNTKTYLLLGLVLVIWGIIAYRIISALNSDPQVPQNFDIATLQPLEFKKRDTFSIKADYRDPFLGTLPKKKTNSSVQSQKNTAPTSEVVYTGSVENSKTRARVYFVTINGQQQLLQRGKTVNGITLVTGSKSAITIRENGQTRKIPLAK